MKRSRIKPRSDKMAKRMREYNKLRLIYLQDNPKCEAIIEGERLPCCNYQSDQIHHKRGRVGDLLTDTEHWMALCDPCHKAIHHEVEWARENGFIESRNHNH